jgi:hypothetical protein
MQCYHAGWLHGEKGNDYGIFPDNTDKRETVLPCRLEFNFQCFPNIDTHKNNPLCCQVSWSKKKLNCSSTTHCCHASWLDGEKGNDFGIFL